MIANLPLLFVRGSPRGLAAAGAEELERFITFMVTCSWGHDTARDIRRPGWWPRDVDFCYPFRRPRRAPPDWEPRLKRLVRACYDHHKSAFLLVFSAQLARYPRRRLRYVDNRDHTTSLYHRPSGRLLVTFRNENLFYDAPAARPSASSASATPDHAEPGPADVYLCDHCDNHFDNPEALGAHERLCGEGGGGGAGAPGGLPEFLAALKLRPTTECADKPVSSGTARESRPGRTAAGSERGPSYPFSSLAGLRNARPSTRDNEFSRERIERYCCADSISTKKERKVTRKRPKFPVRYRRPIDYWHRQHIFPKQRNKELLDVEGQLLLLRCRPIGVRVERMSQESMQSYIDNLKQIAEARRAEEVDIEFVGESKAEAVAECDMKDPLDRRVENTWDDIIDLCSDDEMPSVKENSDPRAGVTCIMRGGAVLRRTAATPHALPSEPCGAARRRPAAVLQPHPVILFTQSLRNLPIISLD